VLVGGACAVAAGGGWHVDGWLAALGGALLIQIGTNLVNDVADFQKGADRADRVGPLRVTQAGLLSPRQVMVGAALAFALAFAVGVYLVTIGGPWIVAIGLASIISGIAYTAGPLPLGYLGLGDLFVFGFFGFAAVCGTALVTGGAVPRVAWLA